MQELKLPKPDEFGNYWLGAKREAPAIMRSKRLHYNDDAGANEIVDNGNFFATTADGPLFDGSTLRKFRTPHEALEAIKEQPNA